MKATGVKGIKVDFFGGDKQATMKLYEDILTECQPVWNRCCIPRLYLAARLGTHVSESHEQ